MSCHNPGTFKFDKVECVYSAPPAYDGEIVSIVDNTGKAIRDTLVAKIDKKRNVFKPCVEYIYMATYRDKSGNVISKSKIWMMATGKRWEWQPAKQDEVKIQYEFYDEDISNLKAHSINKELSEHVIFTRHETTGIIENVRETWMHPFRSNQYNFTEVAAFPHVQYPLEIGKKWSSNLAIGQGWGSWEGAIVNSSYKVIKKSKMKFAFGELNDCWLIETNTIAQFGNSYHNFWFNENYGFVKMEYKNYQGQTLEIELISVSENG